MSSGSEISERVRAEVTRRLAPWLEARRLDRERLDKLGDRTAANAADIARQEAFDESGRQALLAQVNANGRSLTMGQLVAAVLAALTAVAGAVAAVAAWLKG